MQLYRLDFYLPFFLFFYDYVGYRLLKYRVKVPFVDQVS